VTAPLQPAWIPAYVALGSNLDEPARQVLRAFDALGALTDTRLVARSRLYRTMPLGPIAQPEFVNAVAGLLTQRTPEQLLADLKALETALGRETPVVRWGPRRIDLDLLVHGTSRLAGETLTLPHPGLAERAFVLVPFADVAPELDVPGLGRVQTLLQKVDTTHVHEIDAA
jgi:2-amino-4-hydroxy-6-hydroxymethyldihydropteridine diphosphokinase